MRDRARKRKTGIDRPLIIERRLEDQIRTTFRNILELTDVIWMLVGRFGDNSDKLWSIEDEVTLGKADSLHLPGQRIHEDGTWAQEVYLHPVARRVIE